MGKQTITLKAKAREVFGRKTSRLRRAGILPANVFGRDVKSFAVEVDAKDFERTYKEAGETGVVELDIGNDKRYVLVHDIQRHPVSDQILHVDFLQVDLKKKVSTQVPVELVGVSPAEKQGLGTVVQYINEIEVEALPTDIPHKFEIDITGLDAVDSVVKVADISFDEKKIKINADPENVVARVEPPREEEKEQEAQASEKQETEEAQQPEQAESSSADTNNS
jgi:large subunit ribosomal protein L25